MYCPNCGAGNLDSDTNFCPECGTQISNIQSKTHTIQSNTTNNSPVQQNIAYQPLMKPLFQYPSSEMGSNSKRALGFSIASLALLAGTCYFAYLFFDFMMLRNMMTSLYSSPSYVNMVPALIIIVPINGLGLVFGIVARVCASKAKKYALDNTVRKVGGVFSILGIVFNSIAIGLAVFLGPLLVYNFSYMGSLFP